MSDSRPSEIEQEARMNYGCDRCGRPKDAHKGDELFCPHSQMGGVRWREPSRFWIDDDHQITAELHYDSFIPVLVCGGAPARSLDAGVGGKKATATPTRSAPTASATAASLDSAR